MPLPPPNRQIRYSPFDLSAVWLTDMISRIRHEDAIVQSLCYKNTISRTGLITLTAKNYSETFSMDVSLFYSFTMKSQSLKQSQCPPFLLSLKHGDVYVF